MRDATISKKSEADNPSPNDPITQRPNHRREFMMAVDFDFPVETNDKPTQPLLWVSYRGFLRATGEDLRTPVASERKERLNRGLLSLDNDFPGWLEEMADDSADGVTLRFRDLEALRNVESKLRDRGLNDR